MILRELFEARAKAKSVGIIFGRFNPPHMGHIKAWEMASENPAWYVGTNRDTQGPKDPLPYNVKVEVMKTMYPDLEGHLVSEISWLTLASKVYEKHGNIVLNVYTDEDWVTKTLVQYNGKEGQHGYYDFGTIQQQVTPRLSSATALRAAVAADDRQAFSQAAGVDADTPVAGHAFFDVVKHYLMPYAAKAAAKPVKKKVKEPVAEGTSIESTLRAIITDIGEPITNVYDTMKFQAKKYMENHGELDRGFRMVAAGIGGRWVQNMYVGKLQNELYDLCKYNTRRTVELQQFLRGVETGDELEMKRSFGSIAKDLPSILAKLGQYLDAPQLTKNANRWMQNKAAYEEYIANLELEDDYDEPATARAPKDTTVGQQRSQVEDIVNDVLSKLPKKIAGDIRNAIARAPNKLQALQAELKKHGQKSVAEGSLGEVLPWPVVANKISSAMKAMGWKAQRKGDDAFLFSTKGAEDESQYYMVMIDNEGDGMFTYALGTFEGGRPDIGEQGKLPTTAASVSEVLMAIRDGYGLDEGIMNFMTLEKPKVKKPTTALSAMRKEFEKEKSKNPDQIERGEIDKNAQQVYTKRSDENAWDRLQREKALESAGVGIITKQNTTVDVNKNTPKKNLKAFRLA